MEKIIPVADGFTLSYLGNSEVSYIDMEPIFRNDFENFAEKFEFPTDGHWNERAHRLVATAFLNFY